ncbi:GNAT family N-acetyltransferase [Falsiroseomonas sp. CW058]|uniref:GNAT family N-acetyltransferase n=1 Tax=Falsiroseomonas sp. CW058 TaxID=3388664 RepID=UPI003D322DC9
MPPDGLRVEEVAALEPLRAEWQALWAQLPDATPFQSPAWLIPWWRHVGEGALLTLAFRTEGGGELVALLPFYVYRQADGRRMLFPLGIATTDYLDALVAPEHRAAVLPRILPELALRGDRWDACEWPQLRAGSALLDAPLPPGWAEDRAEADPCPVLHLPPRIEELGEAVPRDQLESLGRRRQRAAKKGALGFERAGPGNAAELLEAHLRLHAARWTKRGEEGVLAEDAVQAAHRASLPDLLRDGALRLYAMRLDGRIVATLQGFADPPGRVDRRVYFYLGGFDPAVERLSPGMLVVGHAIEEAVREGAAAVDFLRGQERHKYLWGAVDTPTWRRAPRRPAP